MNASAQLTPYRVLEEPKLAFDGGRPDAIHTHPLRGLLTFGPHSRHAQAFLGGSIRIATIGPPGTYFKIGKLLSAFRDAQPAKERKQYLPEFPGIRQVFGVDIAPAPSAAHLEIPGVLDFFEGEGHIGHRVAIAIGNALRQLAAQINEFDVVAIHLPESWSPAFTDAETDFDLHDTIKGVGADLGIATQILNDDPWNYHCRASVAWRLTIALYTKSGGTPWKLAQTPAMADTAYVGLAYARRGNPSEGRFVTCCSQVFDADGGGMQFVAFDIGEGIDLRNPFLSRSQMRSVMARSVALYQKRHGGGLPRRMVIHKAGEFKEEEITGADDALRGIREIECIQVQSRTSWRAVRLLKPKSTTDRNQPDSWPIHRGTMIPLSGRSTLLWSGGNAPTAAERGNYFQGGNSIPSPLLLTRFAGKNSLESMASEVLALTKMDWNNDALFDPLPVTIMYSKRLAKTISSFHVAHLELMPRCLPKRCTRPDHAMMQIPDEPLGQGPVAWFFVCMLVAGRTDLCPICSQVDRRGSVRGGCAAGRRHFLSETTHPLKIDRSAVRPRPWPPFDHVLTSRYHLSAIDQLQHFVDLAAQMRLSSQ
jgi:hypothetical protein